MTTERPRRPHRALAVVAALTVLGACGGGDDGDDAPAATTSAGTKEASPTAPAGSASSGPPASTPSSSAPDTTAGGAATPARASCPYRGLGTWVDVYDYMAAFAEHGIVAPVGPEHVSAMAAAGVETLYLQAAKDDPRSPGTITDVPLVSGFLEAAHDAGMSVVAWYLPTHRDEALDVARTQAMASFESGRGDRFDAIALDIEGIEEVDDVAERNRRLIDLVAELDRVAGDTAVGSIVYPPVAFDVLNPDLWPDFPWQQLAAHTDVWLPMAYWTYREVPSPYRDAYAYTIENIDRLRAHVGEDAVVHAIGGIADESTTTDYDGFTRAAGERDSIGVSVYDWNTMDQAAWPSLDWPAPTAGATDC